MKEEKLNKRKNEEEDEGIFGNDEDNIPKKNNGKEAKKAKTGDEMYDIGARKKLTVGNYKGNLLINIREYYEDKKTGEEKVNTFIFCVILSYFLFYPVFFLFYPSIMFSTVLSSITCIFPFFSLLYHYYYFIMDLRLHYHDTLVTVSSNTIQTLFKHYSNNILN